MPRLFDLVQLLSCEVNESVEQKEWSSSPKEKDVCVEQKEWSGSPKEKDVCVEQKEWSSSPKEKDVCVEQKEWSGSPKEKDVCVEQKEWSGSPKEKDVCVEQKEWSGSPKEKDVCVEQKEWSGSPKEKDVCVEQKEWSSSPKEKDVCVEQKEWSGSPKEKDVCVEQKEWSGSPKEKDVCVEQKEWSGSPKEKDVCVEQKEWSSSPKEKDVCVEQKEWSSSPKEKDVCVEQKEWSSSPKEKDVCVEQKEWSGSPKEKDVCVEQKEWSGSPKEKDVCVEQKEWSSSPKEKDVCVEQKEWSSSPKEKCQLRDTCQRRLSVLLHTHVCLILVCSLAALDAICVIGQLICDILIMREKLDHFEHIDESLTPLLLNHIVAFDRSTHEKWNLDAILEVITGTDPHTNNGPLPLPPERNWTSSLSSTGLHAGHRSKRAAQSGVPGHEIEHGALYHLTHAFHLASMVILSMLLLETLLKVFAMGKKLKHNKLEVFDAVVVAISWSLDVAFYQGIWAHPGTKAATLLTVLLPWRVIRIVNSFVLVIQEKDHVQLKIVKQRLRQSLKKSKESIDKASSYRHEVKALAGLCRKLGASDTEIGACSPSGETKESATTWHL
ncbi:hypothetical protein RRG08_014290 [Elysia crispata]|uniref:Voltage-gated hydrogen channel 1 n=1 Tax=Elysia crispata TaxID=231223 RepID=A0AAE0Y1T5_9GAST|nr:hypothetical protein RRG08_014290 [Elysia crispata]